MKLTCIWRVLFPVTWSLVFKFLPIIFPLWVVQSIWYVVVNCKARFCLKKGLQIQVSYSFERWAPCSTIFSWADNSRLYSQDFFFFWVGRCRVWNPWDHYRVHKSPSLRTFIWHLVDCHLSYCDYPLSDMQACMYVCMSRSSSPVWHYVREPNLIMSLF